MERMKREIPKHCNSLDRIRALENENKRLEEENKKLNIKVASLE
jgi:predicted nuclease with TOPRIM domain